MTFIKPEMAARCPAPARNEQAGHERQAYAHAPSIVRKWNRGLVGALVIVERIVGQGTKREQIFY